MKKLLSVKILILVLALCTVLLASCELGGSSVGTPAPSGTKEPTVDVTTTKAVEDVTDGTTVSPSDSEKVTEKEPDDGTSAPDADVTTVPDATTPEMTEPDSTTPEVTEPEVTTPEVTEPDVTTPEVTEPEDTDPPAPHVHIFGKWTAVKDASCTSEGREERKCDCGKSESRVINKLAHTEVTDAGYAATCTVDGLTDGKHCTVCSVVTVKQQTITATGHTEVTDAGYAATCTVDGLTDGKHCSVCSAVTVKQQTITAKGHTEITDAGYAATCTVDGLTDGKHCTVCSAVTVKQQTITAKGHTEVTDAGYAATCTVDGLTDGKHCTVCSAVTVKQQTITATGHTEVTDAGYAATCTVDGLTDGKHCTVCSAVTVKQQTITAKGHTEVTDTGYAATCTVDGLTDGKHCTVCSAVTVKQQTITAKGHTEVIDYGYSETCTTNGMTDGSHCGVCGTVIKEKEEITAGGHTEVTDTGYAATCTVDGLTDGKHCVSCGAVTEPQQTITARGHTEVSLDSIPASCTQRGHTEGKWCSVCFEVFVSSESYLLPHEYSGGYCVNCNEREGSAGLLYQYFTVSSEIAYEGYYVTGIENGYTPSELYLPSSYSDGVHGTYEVVGIGGGAFSCKDYISEVYFSKNIKTVERSAFSQGADRRFHLNEGLEILEAYCLGYITGDLVIPESVRAIGAQFAENTAIQYLDESSTRLYFLGDFPEYLGWGTDDLNVPDEMFHGFIVIYDPAKEGWPGTNRAVMHQGILYRNDYDPDSLYNDDMMHQISIATELCYATAQRSYPDWASMDWTQLRVTDTQEKYEYILAFANELTKDCTTDAERINVIFEWLNTNIEYDMGAVYDDMYDALINKRGVCAHYSTLMVQMLRCLNIPSMIVNGYLWDGLQFPIPSSIKWMDDHYAEVTGNHSWLIAYDGESWKTYDPTNDYIFKDYDLNHFYHLFPTSVEGLQIVGEGSYTYSYLDTVPLFIEDGVWYRRTYYGYDVSVNDFWYDYYAIISMYNQASDTVIYYRLIYKNDGTLETGLIKAQPFTDGNTVTTNYYYVLENGRALANVTLTLDGNEYYFDYTGTCTVTESLT